jgi:hypothetical protein
MRGGRVRLRTPGRVRLSPKLLRHGRALPYAGRHGEEPADDDAVLSGVRPEVTMTQRAVTPTSARFAEELGEELRAEPQKRLDPPALLHD